MLKGTVTFETFKDGKLIQKESAENMVTDAVDKILAMSPWWDDSVPSQLPIAQNILGGLYLFDNTLTESSSNYHLPGNAKIVGHGGRLTDVQDPIRGTFDDVASGPVEGGYKNVWKFTEDQANGRIASASLTSKEAGAGFFFNYWGSYYPPRRMIGLGRIETYGYMKNSGGQGYDIPLLYDEENKELYYGIITDPTNNVFTIYKRKFNLYSYGVNDGGNPGLIDTVYPATVIGTVEGINIRAHNTCFGHDGYLYISDYSNSNNAVYFNDLKRLDLNALKNGTVTVEHLGEKTFTMPSGNQFILIFNNGYVFITAGGYQDVVRRYSLTDGSYVDCEPLHPWCEKQSNEYTIVLRSFHNGLVVESIGKTDSTTTYANIYYSYTERVDGQDVPKCKYLKMTSGCAGNEGPGPWFDIDLVRFLKSGTYIDFGSVVLQEYLGTIFNLPNAVNKDDTMTMTVTYTLTNVTENS